MSDHTNGLRFDVYERVHLPDDVAAIDELEEIELVPRIQVIDQGDHAVLKGQLLLSGIYRSQNESDVPLTLEHWIPVEITLPMNRITRLDDISIEIDNFDVDLLSARTLNVTGVLSLRGISAQPIFEQQEESWREEPFTVVHQRQSYDERLEEEFAPESEGSRQPYISEEGVQESEADFVHEQEQEQEQEWANQSDATVTISSSTTDSGWSSAQFFSPIVQRRDEEVEVETGQEEASREITYNSQITSDEGWLASSSQYVDAVESEPGREEQDRYDQWQQSERIANAQALYQQQQEQELEQEIEPVQELVQEQEADYNQVQYREPDPIPEQSPPEQEKQELRIAFSGKQPEDNSGAAPNVGILTLLQSSRREQATRQAAEQVVAQQLADERARVQASGDEIEWQNLFLGKQSEDNDFRKIRVCIVQRDETLELIALRYSMKPREILLHNRLDESSISEGQLLYIP